MYIYMCRDTHTHISYKTFKVVVVLAFHFGKCKKFKVNCRRSRRAEKASFARLTRRTRIINKIKLIVTIETMKTLSN